MIDTQINEIRFKGSLPAIGYTDYINIYTSLNVHGEELEVLRKHEKSHIWLQHYSRGLNLLREKKEINNKLWNIAVDLEIAKHIYTEDDIYFINRPRSILEGGITKKDCDKYPDILYAEDYYEELLKESEEELEKLSTLDGKGNLSIVDNPQENGNKINLKDLENIIIDIIQHVEEENLKAQSIKLLQKHQDSINNFKGMKPSLYSEIDKHLGRHKIKREPSYKRFNHRVETQDLFKKGFTKKFKTPKVTIYIDRSGSFCANKTKDANDRLTNLLKKYRSSIEKDVIYFNDSLICKDPINGNGGTNYNAVIDDIIRTVSELSIIITDDDQCNLKAFSKLPKIIIIPVGCNSTWLSKQLNVLDLK